MHWGFLFREEANRLGLNIVKDVKLGPNPRSAAHTLLNDVRSKRRPARPHNEQDALLAAACPLPDMVAGVGHVFHRGEYWLLVYESCGHDQYFRRTADGLYDLADVEAEIRQRYATCGTCAWAPTRAQLESLAQLSP